MSVYGKKVHQGRWKPSHPEKYVGNVDEIVFRSSWELKIFIYFDTHPSVVEWSSESVVIPYFDPVANKQRRYFVDFWAMIKQKNGTIKKFLIEVKPDKFTRPPTEPKRKTKRYAEEVMQYVTNCAKWEAAEKVCKDSGVEFLILTEKHIFNNGKPT